MAKKRNFILFLLSIILSVSTFATVNVFASNEVVYGSEIVTDIAEFSSKTDILGENGVTYNANSAVFSRNMGDILQGSAGITFSGGEPLVQGEFITEAMKALKKEGIRSAIDVSGTYVDQHTEKAVAECDLVLLDIKHPDPERFKIITGRDQDTLFEIIDLINRHDKHVWVRNVVVPDINDTEEDIELLNQFMTRLKHIDKVELLGYHTMAVNKYGKLGITYRLKGVPAMNGDRLNQLRQLVKKPADAVTRVAIETR